MNKWYVVQADIHIDGCIFYDISQTPQGVHLLEFDANGDNPLFAAAVAITEAGLETAGLHIRYAGQ